MIHCVYSGLTCLTSPTVAELRNVTITAVPESRTVSLTDALSLTCTTELDPAVDGGVTVESTWTGPGGAVLSSDGRVSISGGTDSTPPYESTLNITSVESSDVGDYNCSVSVSPSSVYVSGETSGSDQTSVVIGRLVNIFFSITFSIT